MKIEDGTGNGTWVKVTDDNSLKVRGTTDTHMMGAVIDDQAYLATFSVLFYSADTTGFAYLRNDGFDDIIVNKFDFYASPVATDFPPTSFLSSSHYDAYAYKTVDTTSTLVVSGTDVEPYNMNLGSPTVPDVTLKQGGTALAVTGTMMTKFSLAAPAAFFFDDRPFKLPPGATLAFTVDPPSQTAFFALTLHIYFTVEKE